MLFFALIQCARQHSPAPLCPELSLNSVLGSEYAMPWVLFRKSLGNGVVRSECEWVAAGEPVFDIWTEPRPEERAGPYRLTPFRFLGCPLRRLADGVSTVAPNEQPMLVVQ